MISGSAAEMGRFEVTEQTGTTTQKGPVYATIPPSALDESGRLRVLVVFPPSFSATVCAMPVPTAIKKAHSNAIVGVAVEEGLVALFEGHPAVTHVHPMPWRRRRQMPWWKRLWYGYSYDEFRSAGYRAAVDLAGLAQTARLTRKSGASIRIGFAAPEAGMFSSRYYTVRILPSPHLKHMIDRNLSLLVPLAVKRGEPSFAFPEAIAGSEPAGQRERLAVLHIGAGWPSRLWPPEHFASLAEKLTRELTLEVHLTWSGDFERSRAETIASMARGRARVSKPLDLHALARLLRRSALCVGADTGPVQLACALGTPTVMLFGPTRHERTGPRSPKARAACALLGCAGCMLERCPEGTGACMRAISPDEVFEIARSLIS